eukprot:TRINITY_DN27688_c0_g1_i1.p1 TRINITY_DN27688_c0_g1~~TRINITY_DN27688_c0_g1_i1.p1  ORF type:complete len:518 (+),score=142.97 TRINITY_DN27688_c0_g1_i1:60-1613(+)
MRKRKFDLFAGACADAGGAIQPATSLGNVLSAAPQVQDSDAPARRRKFDLLGGTGAAPAAPQQPLQSTAAAAPGAPFDLLSPPPVGSDAASPAQGNAGGAAAAPPAAAGFDSIVHDYIGDCPAAPVTAPPLAAPPLGAAGSQGSQGSSGWRPRRRSAAQENQLDLSDADEWECVRCTFRNPPARGACAMCEAPRAGVAEVLDVASSSTDEDLIPARRRGKAAGKPQPQPPVAEVPEVVEIDAPAEAEAGAGAELCGFLEADGSDGFDSDALGEIDAAMVDEAEAAVGLAPPPLAGVDADDDSEDDFKSAFVIDKAAAAARSVQDLLGTAKKTGRGGRTKQPDPPAGDAAPLLGLDPHMRDIQSGRRGGRKPAAKRGGGGGGSRAPKSYVKCHWATVNGRRTLFLINGQKKTGSQAYKYWKGWQAFEAATEAGVAPAPAKPTPKRKPAAKKAAPKPAAKRGKKTAAAAQPDLKTAFSALAARPKRAAEPRPLPSRAFYDASHEGLPQWNDAFMEHEGL